MTSAIAQERSLTILVPTSNVFPNPLNPRKNDGINTEEMQSIINKRGWEEPLSAYKKNEDSEYYVLLSGHRRLFAANKAGIKEVPIYVRPKPSNPIEEIERIGSLQSGRVNWSQYEWASYTYNLWLQWGKPAKTKFAKDINLSVNAVTNYILIMEYYDRNEIEGGLQRKELTIGSLAGLVKWIRALDNFKPSIVRGLGEDMIKRVMLEKIANKTVTRDSLRFHNSYCKEASIEDIKKFLRDKTILLSDQIQFLNIQRKYNDFNGHMRSMGMLRNRIPNIKVETQHQKESAIESLETTMKELQAKLNELKGA
ncbi:ParB/RepB/Spo0J family partition protein [Priestia megaterium]|uniref:ParB/RepB/Spo0J family partition protein n=1 Tax=Priestia megaterium TaxID=1404 RepID=UPI002E1E9E89|nr:ParB/RepB/Spo0J family partition protein [Priestia megaterium]